MIARISRVLHDELLALAAASPSVEVCGLVLCDPVRSEPVEGRTADAVARGASLDCARDERILALRATANVADDPSCRFEIDPVELFAALRAERGGGPRLIGHYHSHPHGPAEPSACDAAMAHDAGRLWLIVGEGRVAAWRATRGGPVHDAFAPVDLIVSENGCETGH